MAFNFTVTALDQFNSIATGYGGTVHLTSSDGEAVLPANSILTNGAGTFSATLKTAGNQTITATDTANASINGTSNNITVSAAAATHFNVSAPSSATAGLAFNLTVTALDQFNNTATSYGGTAHFTSSDSTATLPANTSLTNGTGSFSASLRTAGNQTITATDTVNSSVTGTSNSIAVSAAAATHFSVSVPSTATAGSPFNFTVTALDQFNNTATSYGGTVHLTSSDSAATLPANSTLTNGTGSFSASLKAAGNQTITATDTVNNSVTGTSNSIAVSAAGATHFSVSAPSSVTAGSALNFTVAALDSFNNVAAAYSGTVHFSSSDGQAVLPSNSTLANGAGSFSATLKSPGNQTITATDAANSSITGTSNTTTVSAGAATHFSVSAPAAATAGSAFSFTVRALDQFDNTANGYSGTVHFSSSDGQAVLPSDSALASGTGTFSATLKSSGNQTITATDTANSSITGTSNAIAVSAPPRALAITSHVFGGGGGVSAGGSLGLIGTVGQHDAALSNGGSITLVGGFFSDASLSAATQKGTNVTVALGNATVTFTSVSTAGTATISPIDPNAQGTPPPGYSVGGTAFDISTTATYTAPITICFNMSSVTDPTDFSNLTVLHLENGVLVDRTSSHDFPTKTVCATVPTLSPFVIATLNTPRGDKQRVLDQLIALRATVTNKEDGDKLDEAIKHLTASLDNSLWIDQTHLQPKGGETAFNEEKDTVNKLRDLLQNKKSAIADALLQGFIDRIVNADRRLALVVINEAIAAHGDQKEIANARDELAKGDSDIASAKHESGIEHYRNAWQHALKATGKS
jgi:hypothetical protein